MIRCWLLAALWAVPAATTVAGALWATTQQAGLDYAEPVIYSQALRLHSGEPLYQPLDQLPYSVAAYTPLFYWLAAVLQVAVGPGFGPGRYVSVVCGVLCAALIA